MFEGEELKFSKKFSKRKKIDIEQFVKGIWDPNRIAWRDVVEDYLYISRKRINNKLSMFKLQLAIITDILQNSNGINVYKKELNNLRKEKEENKITERKYNSDREHFNFEIFNLEFLNTALREVMDGIAWRYFNSRGLWPMRVRFSPPAPVFLSASVGIRRRFIFLVLLFLLFSWPSVDP